MKAYVLHGINDFRYEDVSEPNITDNQVLVTVKAAGICGSDIPRIYSSGTYSYPLIPGHEFSGKVIKLGSNVDSKWIDENVGVFPLIPCNSCKPCIEKKFELCRNYNYLGSRIAGGFAEFVAVPENNLIKLPKNITYEAAAMLEPMSVAVHAIRKISPKINDTVVVFGLGTIGLFITMFLIEMDIQNIYVVGNKESQKNVIMQMGINEMNYCDSSCTDVNKWLSKQTDKYGFDACFECVGSNETISLAVNNSAPCGKIAMVGNPHFDIKFNKSVYWNILRNQLTIKGMWNSTFTHEDDDDWHYVLNKLSLKKILPENIITHIFTLDKLEKGFHIMRDKTADYIKIIMRNI